jgi:hypothetical protein
MKIPRWFVSTCLGTIAVCCVLHPLWSSRHPASPPNSRDRTAGLTNVSVRPERSATGGNKTAVFQALAQRPLSFERNIGQSAPNIQFVLRGLGVSVVFLHGVLYTQ